MKLFLLGGTGFIGNFLTSYFLERKWEITLLVRNLERAKAFNSGVEFVIGDALTGGDWQKKVSEADFVINLVGETIFKRWTREYKRRIWDSRILSTQRVVEAMREGQVLFNASAVGYYGDGGEKELTENSPPGDMFVSQLCKAWEDTAFSAEKKGVRVIIGRFGIVLGKGGGMLSVILPIFKLGLGGRLGSGRQWFPWIHIEDLVRAIEFLYLKGESGVFNLTSPNPVRNLEFTKTIGKVLKRPTFLPVPKIMLKVMYGELADVIMASARVIPARLISQGFNFKYPNFEEALRACL